MTVGERIVWARKRKGISQEALADMIGTSRRHMIRLEKNVHTPGEDFVARIAEATGQEPAFFTVVAVDDDDEEAALALSLDDFLRLRIRSLLRDELRAATS